MKRTEKPPPNPSWGWKAIIAVFVTLGISGVVLAALFRDYSSNPDELTVKERRRNAEQVAYSVVFSSVPEREHQRIIKGIAEDIGADSSSTDLVIGSTATNPWSKSLDDYKASLTTAMSESSQLRLGKQTLILSMIGGIMTKNFKPATIYLIGDMQDTLTQGVVGRTMQTIAAFEVRHEVHAPIRVVSYLDTANNPGNAQYARLFSGRVFDFEQR